MPITSYDAVAVPVRYECVSVINRTVASRSGSQVQSSTFFCIMPPKKQAKTSQKRRAQLESDESSDSDTPASASQFDNEIKQWGALNGNSRDPGWDCLASDLAEAHGVAITALQLRRRCA
jgi:hypothetical protein